MRCNKRAQIVFIIDASRNYTNELKYNNLPYLLTYNLIGYLDLGTVFSRVLNYLRPILELEYP